MLMQSSLPGSIEDVLSFGSDHGKGEWSGTENWKRCPMWETKPLDGYKGVPVALGITNVDDMFSNCANSSQLSTVSTISENYRSTFVYRRRKLQIMSENSKPFVYQRKKLQRNDVSGSQAPTAKQSVGGISAISSEADSLLGKEAHMVSVIHPVECTEVFVLNSVSVNGSFIGEEPSSKEAPKSDIHRASYYGCVNDSHSSSKSIVELGSSALRTEVDDTGECSSCSALVVDDLHDDRSEKDIFISILRSQGLLESVLPNHIHSYVQTPNTRSDNSYIWTCKICDRPETTVKMLICDQCEEAFHVSCCNPRLKKIPADEWFCCSCLKKRRKILKEDTTSKSVNIRSGTRTSRGRNATSDGELGPMASMLIDTEPYEPALRIGQDFQAEVPDWCGPSLEELDIIGDPLEINPSECVSLLGWNSNKPCRLSTIGNWLQCRDIIEGIGEGVNGTICGKWRRAPLFEFQTDDWQCFCAVLWDPAHADCAVPQELDTDQVLKQLKYIEMLRPRLSAKKHKLDLPGNAGSPADVRNIQ